MTDTLVMLACILGGVLVLSLVFSLAFALWVFVRIVRHQRQFDEKWESHSRTKKATAWNSSRPTNTPTPETHTHD